MTSHVRVELWPELMEAGLALKEVMIGALDFVTVTVADAVGLPALLDAVRGEVPRCGDGGESESTVGSSASLWKEQLGFTVGTCLGLRS